MTTMWRIKSSKTNNNIFIALSPHLNNSFIILCAHNALLCTINIIRFQPYISVYLLNFCHIIRPTLTCLFIYV